MNLPPEARSVIVGSLLGDAHLTRNGSLQIEHCLAHADYVFWKYEMLKILAGKPPVVVERYDSRTAKTYRSTRFYSRSVLKNFRDDFYRGRTKIVPDNIGRLLDPLAVAVWFMDDGGRGGHTPRGLVFNTSGFSSQEQILLQSVLREKFGIEASIHLVGSGFQLYVRARSFSRFCELVSPHLVTLMRYKLPVDPVTTSPPRRRDRSLARECEPIYDCDNTSALTGPVR
jgi:sRNA-binding regulator protein Hfq